MGTIEIQRKNVSGLRQQKVHIGFSEKIFAGCVERKIFHIFIVTSHTSFIMPHQSWSWSDDFYIALLAIVDKKPALLTFIIIGVTYNWVIKQNARARKSCCAPREQRARPVLRNTAPNWLTIDCWWRSLLAESSSGPQHRHFAFHEPLL